MKEKNLKRSAHFISVLLNVGCIVFGVLSMALFIGIIAIVCTQLFRRICFRKRGKLLLKMVNSLALDNAYSFLLAVLVCLSVSF